MPSIYELGPCCGCGRVGRDVRRVVQVPRLCPTPGRGWACLLCDLPADGAIAVVCGRCEARLEAGEAWQEVLSHACAGLPREDGRVPIGELTGVQAHDPKMHDLTLEIR